MQGEFGIGLLSYWNIGEGLTVTCFGKNNTRYTMYMRRGEQNYRIDERKVLVTDRGTSLTVSPLLAGVKNLSGEKIQNYLAS